MGRGMHGHPMMGSGSPMEGQGMHGMPMMAGVHSEMLAHRERMENHLAAIESLLKELVELQKK